MADPNLRRGPRPMRTLLRVWAEAMAPSSPVQQVQVLAGAGATGAGAGGCRHGFRWGDRLGQRWCGNHLGLIRGRDRRRNDQRCPPGCGLLLAAGSAARRSASFLARSTFCGFGGRVLASSASQAATSAFSGFEAPSKRSRKLWRPTPGNGFGLNAWELGADSPPCMATIRCVTPKPNAKQLPAITGPTQKRGRRFGFASLAG